jgi:hypothetical protein
MRTTPPHQHLLPHGKCPVDKMFSLIDIYAVANILHDMIAGHFSIFQLLGKTI